MQFSMFSTFLHFVHGTYLDELQQPIGWIGRYGDVIRFTYIVQVVSYLAKLQIYHHWACADFCIYLVFDELFQNSSRYTHIWLPYVFKLNYSICKNVQILECIYNIKGSNK